MSDRRVFWRLTGCHTGHTSPDPLIGAFQVSTIQIASCDKPQRWNNPNRLERIGTEPNVSRWAGRRFGKRALPSQRKHAQSTAKKARERNLPSQAATPPLASKGRFSDFLGIVAMQTCHTPCQVSLTRPWAFHQMGIRPNDKVNDQPYHCCN